MPVKTLLLLLFLVITTLSSSFQCNKDYPQNNPVSKYAFKESVSIFPYQLNYNIGDTIWIDLNIPRKMIFDSISGTRIIYDSLNFFSIAQVDLLYKNPFIANGPLADFIYPQGVSAYSSTGGPQTFTQISFVCAPSSDYHLLLGIILKQKGVFGISFYNSYLRKCFSNSTDPNKLTLAFNVTDTHKSYYLQQPLANIGKTHDPVFLNMLDKKIMVVIDAQ